MAWFRRKGSIIRRISYILCDITLGQLIPFFLKKNTEADSNQMDIFVQQKLVKVALSSSSFHLPVTCTFVLCFIISSSRGWPLTL